MSLEFHHIGIPIDKSKLSEKARYSPLFKMYTEDSNNSMGIHIQYHAFDKESTLDKRIQSKMHVAFKTDNIKDMLKGKQVIMPLYEPFKNYKCAMILQSSIPIELIETSLSEEELWIDKDILNDGILYGDT